MAFDWLKNIFSKRKKHSILKHDDLYYGIEQNHFYFSDNILSHQTVSTAIAILHYVTFSKDKNVMIVANKGPTVVEIIDKIKSIYKNLPFFLQPGIGNWNQKTVVFEDTNCRILSQARSKEPAIGFTIDFLYMDEFAHIPMNIIEPYYRAAFPTVSSINNSKIVITSTPKGFNLFHDLVVKAELPEGDVNKNNYHCMRIPWHMVPNRNVSYFRIKEYEMNKLGITLQDIEKQLKAENWKYSLKFDYERNMNVFTISNLDWETTTDKLRADFKVKGISILEFAFISSWKEDAIRDIGGLANFKQEYDIAFLTEGNGLLQEYTIKKLELAQSEYEHYDLSIFKKSRKDWSKLLFTNNKEIFDPANPKNIHVLAAIDLAEGLRKDYTVINMFKFRPMNLKEIEELQDWQTIYDFFCLEQFGIYRDNTIRVADLCELVYLLFWEYFDNDKINIALEYNTYGETLLSNLPHIYEGNNNYGNSSFIRYNHSGDRKGMGYKLGGHNKPLFIKELENALAKNRMLITHEYSLHEIKSFTRSDNYGPLKYESQTGNDDIVSTCWGASSIFAMDKWKHMVQDYLLLYPNDPFVNAIQKKVNGYDGGLKTDQMVSLSGLLRKNHNNMLPQSNRYK